MKKIYATPQIIVTAFESEGIMLGTSNVSPKKVSKTGKTVTSLSQLK